MRVAGIDGCKGGWVAVVVENGDFAPSSIHIVTDLEGGIECLGLDLGLIDVPIGLGTAEHSREADAAARRELPGRTSTVFSAPCREAFSASSHAEACQVNRQHLGSGMTIQSFCIMPKIAEVDALLTRRRDLPLKEGHPEVSFALLAGQPMKSSKKKAPGKIERKAKLVGLGFDVSKEQLKQARADARSLGCKVGWDDILDAAILAWSAGRVSRRCHRSFPDPAQTDSTGLPMTILA